MATHRSEKATTRQGSARLAARVTCALGAGVALMAAVGMGAAPAGATTKATNTLIDNALYDALTSGFVHEVSTSTGQGQALKMVNDIGPNEGQQTLVSGAAFGQVLVIGHQTFVRGNTQALVDLFNLSKSVGTTDADQWLAVPPSNPHYTEITAGATLKSDFNELPIPNSLTAGAVQEYDGQKVIPITGKMAATKHDTALHMTMYVSDSKNNPYPVGMTFTVDHTTQSFTWSKWGETPALSAPSTNIALPGGAKTSANSATVTAV